MAWITNPRILRKEEYGFGSWSAEMKGWRVVRVARERWRPRFHPSSGSRVDCSLTLVREGRGGHRTDGQTWDLQPGAVIISRPGSTHETWSLPGHPLVMDILVIAGSKALPLLDRTLAGSPPVIVPSRPDPVHRAFDRLFDEARRDPPFVEDICRCFAEALLHTLRGALVATPAGSRGWQVYRRCRARLESAGAGSVNLRALARAEGVGLAHLSRLFARFAGQSPRAVQARCRMQIAAELLGVGDSVGEVAERLGYATPFAFSRAFKRVVGVPPSSVAGS